LRQNGEIGVFRPKTVTAWKGWTVYPTWGWGTEDNAQALQYLRRFGSVTVLNGHIHQIMQKVEGNITFHSARSTAFPQPEPGKAASPGPRKNVPAAREAYQKGLDIRLKLAQADPTNAQAQRDLSVSYEKLGNVNRQLGNVPVAHEAYQKDLDISLKLAQADPTNAQAQLDLADSLLRLGLVEKSVDDFPAATKRLEQSVEILTKLNQEGKIASQPLYQGWLKSGKWQLQLCNAAPRAIDDLEFALAQPKDMVPELLAIRGRALVHHGKHADTAATAGKLVALDPKDGDNLTMAAGVYALCSAAVASAKPSAEVAADEKQLQERYTARAVELLTQSDAAGYFHVADNRIALKYEHNLDPLRGRDDFKKLLAEVMAPAPVPSSPFTP
jgi:tetratricopeptide (TPR) repeat protein